MLIDVTGCSERSALASKITIIAILCCRIVCNRRSDTKCNIDTEMVLVDICADVSKLHSDWSNQDVYGRVQNIVIQVVNDLQIWPRTSNEARKPLKTVYLNMAETLLKGVGRWKKLGWEGWCRK